MVLKRYSKRIQAGILFMILTVFFSCEKPEYGIIICSDCLSSEPLKADLEIKVSGFRSVAVNIYEGNLEDSIVYESFITNSEIVYKSVPLNRKYTLTAGYYDMGTNFIVVNSVTPRVRFDEEFCDEPCYFIYDRKVNLRLKYR